MQVYSFQALLVAFKISAFSEPLYYILKHIKLRYLASYKLHSQNNICLTLKRMNIFTC